MPLKCHFEFLDVQAMRVLLPIIISLILGNISSISMAEPMKSSEIPLATQQNNKSSFAATVTQKPIIITSDSAPFCGTLIHAIDDYKEATLPLFVLQMRNDGATLCQKGMIRAGLVRLRRALMSLKRTPQ